ncbi:MAG: class I SAM-dependent methyltransferase [Burkholderiaceae bacterium]|nr:class I SAM-dependent methyltransferase [Burkholderiaceae bacterium]
MIGALLRAAKNSRLYAFNQIDRDRWVEGEAAHQAAGSRVLDVGAGSAPYRQLFSHCEYKTQDFAQLQPSQLRDGSYGAIDYVCDATSIPVADASFDVIVCTEVLEHVPEPTMVLREFARILRPGGRVLLSAPLGSGIHQEPHHYFGGFTPWWYQRVLTQEGFDSIVIEPNGGSFRFFGQEAVRFARTTAPNQLTMPLVARVAWTPVWLLLLPVLAGVVPLVAAALDRYDRDRRFTVGYHVSATRRGNQE